MKLIVAGDFCPRERVATCIENDDYEAVVGEVKSVTNDIDYAIVNLECPVVEHGAMPIDKCGPNLRCSRKAIEALKWAGFDCVTLANNHFFDFGETGVKDTLEACRANETDYVGGGQNIKEAGRILYKEINGQKLAIVNCCEHEFSIATEDAGGSNPLNIVKQYYAIQEARHNADHVLIIIHGGVELFWLPSKRMIETFRFFIDSGADAVVNHHQHCYSGYEVYKGKPIFYGLGNFCFDGKPDDYRWTSGYMVSLRFGESQEVNFDIIPYRQCADSPNVRIIHDKEKEDFFEKLNDYNAIIANNEQREEAYNKWCGQNEGMYKVVLNPVNNRYIAWLFESKIGKKIISKRKLLQIFDYLVNESHIERVRMLFNREINKR